MDKTDNQEMISALADGELQGDGFARAVTLAALDGEGRAAWQRYHLIGEVLRTGQACGGAPSEQFLARLRQRLRDEPAPSALPVVVPVAPAVGVPAPAANDARWKLVAGVASFAAVAALGWNLVAPGNAPVAGPQLAVAPPPAVAAPRNDQQAAMIRDPRLDQFLAAHRQLGAATALQTPSGFLRNATFEGAAR